MTEGKKFDEKENEADDWIKISGLIKRIDSTNPNEIIDKVNRRVCIETLKIPERKC